MACGHLTSHNVFITPPSRESALEPKVQIDAIELIDLKKYANKFFSYSNVSVWSAPEVL